MKTTAKSLIKEIERRLLHMRDYPAKGSGKGGTATNPRAYMRQQAGHAVTSLRDLQALLGLR